MLEYFLENNQTDIKKLFPEFELSNKPYSCAFIVVRDLEMAGIFLANDEGTNRLVVELDYVTPAYRDFKIGRYLFKEHVEMFRQSGYKKIVTVSGSRYHSHYLQKVGFVETSSDMGVKTFELDLRVGA